MGATGLILLAPGRRTARTIKKQLSVWDAPGSLRAQDPAQTSSGWLPEGLLWPDAQHSYGLPLGLQSHSALERGPLVLEFFVN